MIDRAEIDEDAGELPTVNRFAVLLVPTEAFCRWANSCPGGGSEVSREDVRREPTVYLIPEGDGDPKDYAERHYRRMLIEELNGWYTDETAWPEDMSIRTFRSFFDVHATSMVFDLGNEPLERDT